MKLTYTIEQIKPNDRLGRLSAEQAHSDGYRLSAYRTVYAKGLNGPRGQITIHMPAHAAPAIWEAVKALLEAQPELAAKEVTP